MLLFQLQLKKDQQDLEEEVFLVDIQQLKEKLSADKAPRIKKIYEIMALELALRKEICCEKGTIKSRSARERTEDERESSGGDSKKFSFLRLVNSEFRVRLRFC